MDERFAQVRLLRGRPRAQYEAAGYWGRSPLWQRVEAEAAEAADKPAVIDGAGTISYGALWHSAREIARGLASSGLGRGDIILVQLPNWHEFALLAVGAELAGVVFAFCPIQWGARETLNALRLLRPRLWFTTTVPRRNDDRSGLIVQARAELGAACPVVVLLRSPVMADAPGFDGWRGDAGDAPVVGASGRDPLEIAVTSGSTGDPKGVLHVHDSAIVAVDSTLQRQGIGAADVVHLAVPVGHTFGYLYGVRCALQARGTLVLQDGWDAAGMVALTERHGVTVSLGPSAFALDLLQLEDAMLARLSGLRVFTLAGDSLPVPVARRVIERLPFRISRGLGMTEFGHTVTTDMWTPAERVVDSVGSVQPEMEIRIADDAGANLPTGGEGRILMRGPFLFAGYVTADAINQDVLDVDGFFDTGDLGFLDADGCLHLTGRVKNIIRRGAETIPVSLIEDLIATHPDVLHAVVVGMPDPRLGEVPVACVQLRAGAVVTLGVLEELLAGQGVTKKFWPSELAVFDTWPLGPTGKIDRRLIVGELERRKS